MFIEIREEDRKEFARMLGVPEGCSSNDRSKHNQAGQTGAQWWCTRGTHTDALHVAHSTDGGVCAIWTDEPGPGSGPGVEQFKNQVEALRKALDMVTTVAELLIREGDVQGPWSLEGCCVLAREALRESREKWGVALDL